VNELKDGTEQRLTKKREKWSWFNDSEGAVQMPGWTETDTEKYKCVSPTIHPSTHPSLTSGPSQE